MKKSYILILLIVVLLGVFFYNRNNTQPVVNSSEATSTVIQKIIPVANLYTGDWKTCRNEKYGYEVKYPAHWVIAEPKQNPARWEETAQCEGLKDVMLTATTTYVASDYIDNTLCVPQAVISFKDWDHPNRIADDKYITDMADRYGSNFVREYHVNGRRWFVYQYNSESPCPPVYPMIVAHNNSMLRLDTHSVSDIVVEAMLTTFKSTD